MHVALDFHRVLMHSSMGTGAAFNSAAFFERRKLQSVWFPVGSSHHMIIATASRAELPHTSFTVINIRSTPVINHSTAAAALHKHTSMYEHVVHHIYTAAQAEYRHYLMFTIQQLTRIAHQATDRSLFAVFLYSLFSAGSGVC